METPDNQKKFALAVNLSGLTALMVIFCGFLSGILLTFRDLKVFYFIYILLMVSIIFSVFRFVKNYQSQYFLMSLGIPSVFSIPFLHLQDAFFESVFSFVSVYSLILFTTYMTVYLKKTTIETKAQKAIFPIFSSLSIAFLINCLPVKINTKVIESKNASKSTIKSKFTSSEYKKISLEIEGKKIQFISGDFNNEEKDIRIYSITNIFGLKIYYPMRNL